MLSGLLRWHWTILQIVLRDHSFCCNSSLSCHKMTVSVVLKIDTKNRSWNHDQQTFQCLEVSEWCWTKATQSPRSLRANPAYQIQSGTCWPRHFFHSMTNSELLKINQIIGIIYAIWECARIESWRVAVLSVLLDWHWPTLQRLSRCHSFCGNSSL